MIFFVPFAAFSLLRDFDGTFSRIRVTVPSFLPVSIRGFVFQIAEAAAITLLYSFT